MVNLLEALNFVSVGGIGPMLCSLLMPCIVLVVGVVMVVSALNMRDHRVLLRTITVAELAAARETERRARTHLVDGRPICLPPSWRGGQRVNVLTPHPQPRPAPAMAAAA